MAFGLDQLCYCLGQSVDCWLSSYSLAYALIHLDHLRLRAGGWRGGGGIIRIRGKVIAGAIGKFRFKRILFMGNVCLVFEQFV